MQPSALILPLALAICCAGMSSATILYWDGGSSTADTLSDNATTTGLTWLGTGAGNWDNGTASTTLATWTAGDSAVFGGSAASQTITAGTLTIGNMTFGSGGDGSGTTGTNYTISGGAITLSIGSVVSTNTNAVISSSLTGSGSLTKQGNATLSLSNVSYTGATSIAGGRLVLNNPASAAANGTGGFRTSSFTLTSGATLEFALSSDWRTPNNGMSFTGTGTLAKSGSGSMFLGGSSTDYATTVNLGSGSLIDIQGGRISLDYAYNKTTWANNKADMNIASGAIFDLWDYGNTGANYVKLDALTGVGTIQRGTGGTSTGGIEIGVDSGTGAFSGVIQDGGASRKINLIKSGNGTQALNGNNTYTGTTTISGGILEIGGSGALASSDITVKNLATLQIGATGKTLKSLAVEGGSTLSLAATTGSTITVTNALTLTSMPSFTVRPLLTGVVAAGNTFDLLTASSVAGPAGTLTTDFSTFGSSRVTGSAAVSGNKLVLTIAAGAENLTWAGGTGIWNVNDAANFTGADGKFLSYDAVTFGNAGAGTVTLEGTLAPSVLTVNSASNYTFSGPGSMVGAGSLSKSGGGTLTLTGANTYTGATTISAGGTLEIGGAGTLGTGGVYAGNIANTGTLLVSTSANQTLSGIISGTGGALTKAGTGTLSLTGANSYTGNTAINNGKLKISQGLNFASAGVAIASAATLEYYSTGGSVSQTPVVISSGKSVAHTNSGTVIINGTGYNAFGGGATGGVTFNMSAGAVFDVQGSDIQFGWGKNAFATNLGSLNVVSGASYHNSDATFKFDALTGGGIIGTAYSGVGTLTLGVSGTTNNPTYGVANNTAEFSGSLKDRESYNTVTTGNLSLIKTGAGTQILSGTNTYHGTTTVTAGTLVINGDQSAATGAVNVNNAGSRLFGTGKVGGDTTINTGAIQSAGGAIANVNKVGKQIFDAAGTPTTNVTYTSGSIFEWDLSANKSTAGYDDDSNGGTPNIGVGTRGIDFDAVDVSGTLTVASADVTGAIFRVVLGSSVVSDNFWQHTQTWTDIFGGGYSLSGTGFNNRLLQVVDASTGNPYDQNALNPGYRFSISGTSLTWSPVPEPTSALAGVLLGSGLLRRRRK